MEKLNAVPLMLLLVFVAGPPVGAQTPAIAPEAVALKARPLPLS